MTNNLSVEEIINIIDQEILWCQTNGDKPNLTVQQKWFVEGLGHAKMLILSASLNKIIEDE